MVIERVLKHRIGPSLRGPTTPPDPELTLACPIQDSAETVSSWIRPSEGYCNFRVRFVARRHVDSITWQPFPAVPCTRHPIWRTASFAVTHDAPAIRRDLAHRAMAALPSAP
jgi:hypothetical protein